MLTRGSSLSAEKMPNRRGVIFGNSSLYAFYRFYQVEVPRFSDVGDVLAAGGGGAPDSGGVGASRGIPHSRPQWVFSFPSSVVKRQACLEREEREPTAWEQVNAVVNSCLAFLRNDQDSVHFEESCRRRIGTGGYVLYTLDKVVSTCIKHLHSMFVDLTTNELLASYALHVERTGSSEAGYRNHCIALLQTGRQSVYRMETAGGALRFWLVGNAAELWISGEEMPGSEEFARISRDFLLAQQPVAPLAERAEEGKRGRSEGSSTTGNSEFDALCEEESEDGMEGKRVKVKRAKGSRRRKREDEEWDSHCGVC